MRMICALLMVFFTLPLKGEVKLCLTMTVKNDGAVIERCLNSVKDIVDCLSICDAGSTDNTIAYIKQFMRHTGIPGEIYLWERQNFSPVPEAQKTLRALQFSLYDTYLLIMDADMVLRASSGFNKDRLEADSYLLVHHSLPLDCYAYSQHLLRASMAWTNRRGVFESWQTEEPYQSVKLSTLEIDNRGDGDFSAPGRDTKILEQVLHNSHILRLAHLNRAQKKYEKAIGWYKVYLAQGKDTEEIWFSNYMIGKCYDDLGQWDLASEWYLKTFKHNSGRSEPLLKLAKHFRYSGQNDLAYNIAKQGYLIPRAEDQILFDASPQCNYLWEEEMSISAFYTPNKEDGYAAASNLLVRKGVPWSVKFQTYKNILFYTQNLKTTRVLPISPELPLIREGSKERYYPMNPSIQKTEKGYKVICRSVNYTSKGAVPSNFKTIDPNGIFRTKNFLLHYDRDLNMLSQQEIFECLPRSRTFNFVQGLEDCRLVGFKNSSWFTCTTSDTNPTGDRQISLCQLPDQGAGKGIFVKKLIPLLGPDPERCEKNWLPFTKNNDLYLIYSYHPFTIFKPDIVTGDCETTVSYEPEHDFTGFRGSAAPIEYKDGYLMLIHETVQFPDQSRVYLHRFLYLDKNFAVQLVSKPFTFFMQGVEFCCSMAIDHAEKDLILGVGVEDHLAYLCCVNLDIVQSMLGPLPR